MTPKYNYNPNNINTEITGRRPGETFHEEIMSEREATHVYESDSLYSILPEDTKYLSYKSLEGFSKATDIIRSSNTAEKLTNEEIATLLERNGVGNTE